MPDDPRRAETGAAAVGQPHLQATQPIPAAGAHAASAGSSGASGPGRGHARPTPVPLHRSDDIEPPSAHIEPGVVVGGRHELIRELGRGGMGVVYLARDIRLGRLVAVKFVLLRKAPARKRFLTEARTTARCTHQNIVVIHEADEFDGLPYMVLEYLKGKTLRDLMDERLSQAEGADGAHCGLSPARALEIVLPMLRALERAHSKGIIHRDLKPENVMLTDAGVVKVLDFGIAKSVKPIPKSLATASLAASVSRSFEHGSATHAHSTKAGSLLGTLPYMSPEQLNEEATDLRADIWAVGIMLFEMIAGHHPMAPLSMFAFERIADVTEPMPRSGGLCSAVGAVGSIIDRCLLKDRADRIGSATELIAELEPLVPGYRRAALAGDASPFAGLSAFQESDTERFFGRGEDTLAVVSRVRAQPLAAIVGPSGAGKSSLVRAGVIPALKRSGEGWQSLIARPGRAPLLTLAGMVERLVRPATSGTPRRSVTRSGDGTGEAAELAGRAALLERLRAEPGYLGAVLRTYAQRTLRRVLLFVDQFEEVFTLCADEEERAAFMAGLAGVADDASSPLRVVLSLRADFLERLAENRSFMELTTRGLTLLPPMGRAGLRAALEKPLAAVGYEFESEETVRDMLDGLVGTRGALPLLQFAATTLWRERDGERRLLSDDSYRAMGGISGALAKHADAVVAAQTRARRKLTRAILERLVTPERTRAVVGVDELREFGGDTADEVGQVIDELTRARLLVVDADSVEIVHESLIECWPTLRRWLDDNQDDAEFLSRLRTAAREWQASDRAAGMLWTGAPADRAHAWRQHYRGALAGLEASYLDAVWAHARRARVRQRRFLYAGFAALVLILLAGAVAVTKAHNEAILEAKRAELADSLAEARALSEELAGLKVRESQRADSAESDRDLVRTAKQELETALAQARREHDRAERARADAVHKAEEAERLQHAAVDARKREATLRKQAEEDRRVAEELRAREERHSKQIEIQNRKIKAQNRKIKELQERLGMDDIDLSQ